MRWIPVLTIALPALVAGSASAQDGGRAELHFADIGGVIREWRPSEDGDALLIEGRNGQWYRATFWSACPGINYTETIAFVTSEPAGSLDRFSSVFVDGERCHFRTFERTTSPSGGSEADVEFTEE